MRMSAGRPSCEDSGAEEEEVKPGTGGRAGVRGRAFSLSLGCECDCECESWLEGCWACGRLDVEGVFGAGDSARGALGNVATICAASEVRPIYIHVSRHEHLTHLVQAVQDICKGLRPVGAAYGISRAGMCACDGGPRTHPARRPRRLFAAISLLRGVSLRRERERGERGWESEQTYRRPCGVECGCGMRTGARAAVEKRLARCGRTR